LKTHAVVEKNLVWDFFDSSCFAMSGEEFVATLRELGYPKADKLDGGSLDWSFENTATQPLLKWLCHDVKTSNVLSSKELKEFVLFFSWLSE
jgi:hypothetical protein